MQKKNQQRLYKIVLELPNGVTRTVQARGSTREVAENRALKRNPTAIGIKRAL